ncbi:MAG: hypothetical protein Fur0012_07330 [Elusimicrobiota bacterium]
MKWILITMLLSVSANAQDKKEIAAQSKTPAQQAEPAKKEEKTSTSAKKQETALPAQPSSATKAVSVQVAVSSSSAVQTVKKEVKKDEDEYSEVMTDSMETENYSLSEMPDSESAVREDSSMIPYYYGKVKGTFNEAGKNFLVLEADDGTVYLLQIYASKSGAYSWKLAGKFDRV